MTAYMATGFYKNMYVGSMRIFETEAEAWEHAESIYNDLHCSTRVYILYNDKPPKLLKKPKNP